MSCNIVGTSTLWSWLVGDFIGCSVIPNHAFERKNQAFDHFWHAKIITNNYYWLEFSSYSFKERMGIASLRCYVIDPQKVNSIKEIPQHIRVSLIKVKGLSCTV